MGEGVRKEVYPEHWCFGVSAQGVPMYVFAAVASFATAIYDATGRAREKSACEKLHTDC